MICGNSERAFSFTPSSTVKKKKWRLDQISQACIRIPPPYCRNNCRRHGRHKNCHRRHACLAHNVNQELPLVCCNNGQRGGSGFREVERLEEDMMYDLVAGSNNHISAGMLPNRKSTSPCHTPAHDSSHSVKTCECERGRIHVLIRWVEQPARQRVREFQAQRLPGSALSLVQMLFGTGTVK